jgi:ribosomal protein S9
MPRVEVVCRKREREWVLCLQISPEMGEPRPRVLQGGSLLDADEQWGGCWLLKSVSQEVQVQWTEDGQYAGDHIELRNQECLLFKLAGESKSEGRRVRHPSTGPYLAVVNKIWERDTERSGAPLAEPESVNISSLSAHYFSIDDPSHDVIAFRTPRGPCEIRPQSTRFALAGNQIEDANRVMGPLFGEDPPGLRADSKEDWAKVGIIVVGEEGGGTGRWRTDFRPDPHRVEQMLPAEVAERKSGWYFVRIYDKNDQLVESMDFRFLSPLTSIEVRSGPPVPASAGHTLAEIILKHSEVLRIARDETTSCNIKIENGPQETALTVPANPECDLSKWSATASVGSPVQLHILVERVWWNTGDESKSPSTWTDRPVVLHRETLSASSTAALWLRTPAPRWAIATSAGFEESRRRPYPIRVGKATVGIPLRDFADSPEAQARDLARSLFVWIESRRVQPGISFAAIRLLATIRVTAIKKNAWAEAEISEGTGKVTVDGSPLAEYFKPAPPRAKAFLQRLLGMARDSGVMDRIDIMVRVARDGWDDGKRQDDRRTTRQYKAAIHALAKALAKVDPGLGVSLRQAGYGKVRSARQKPTFGGGAVL